MLPRVNSPPKEILVLSWKNSGPKSYTFGVFWPLSGYETTLLLKILDAEVIIGDEGFTGLSGMAQAKTQSLY